MAEKKHEQSGFTVTDRRLFTSDGDLRSDPQDDAREDAKKETRPDAKEEKTPPTDPVAAKIEPRSERSQTRSDASMTGGSEIEDRVFDDRVLDGPDREMPMPPTSAEQEAQAAAYSQSSKDLDDQVELSGRSAKEFEMTFERFLASLYMTAMLQLGLMREQGGQPRIDIIGARQTIDTLSLIGSKTKGNLTPAEENFLQNSLYELRMAYVEVTNALARPPQPGPATGTGGR